MKLVTTKNMKDFAGDEPVVSASMRVTKGCNMKCVHCYANGGMRLQNELKKDEIEKVIGQLSDMGCLSIFFTGGEPFTRNDIIELFRYTSENKMSVLTSTNGGLVRREQLMQINKIDGMKIFQVSLDSSKKEIHNQIRNSPNAYDRALKTIQDSVQILGKNVAVATVLMKSNYDDISNIMRLASDLGADTFALNLLLKFGRASENLDSSIREKIESIQNLFATFQELGGRIKFTNNTTIPPFMIPTDMRDELHDKFCFCSFPFLLAVESNGDVAPCDGFLGMKEYIMGNVRNKSIDEIWNSQKMKKIRSIKPEDLKGVCHKCVYRDSCMGGCRAAAYLNYKDMRMPDPVCQQVYDAGLFPKDCLKA